EYGTWEYLYGLQPPGYSNASFLNVSVADAETLYTVGIHQPSFDQIVYGWRSGTGGTSWEPVVVMQYDGSICDMMKMFTIIIAVQEMGPDIGLFGGFGAQDECYDNIPEPWCMFVCMFTLSPIIYFTDDGGATMREAKVPFGFGKAVVAMDRAGETTAYAVGGDELIMISIDGGKSWENIANLPEPLLTYNDVDFIDENVGYVTTGEAEPEPEKTAGMTEEDYAWRIYEHRLRHIQWLHDPDFRREVQLQNAATGAAKGMNGRIFKTTDGGQTWEEVLFSHNESFSQIQMINEEEGWVWSSPLEGITPSDRIYRTTDGGETWVEYTDRLPLQDLGPMAFGLMSFSFNPSGTTGFLGGAGQLFINYKSVLFYTVDRGETWQLDETLLDWGHPMVAFDWAGGKLAYQAGADLSTYRYDQLNQPPVADAGDDAEVAAGQIVILDGGESYDPDGDAITYAWTQLDGATVTLTGADEVGPTFTAPEVGEYEFQLVVDDGQETGHDEVIITATEAPVDDDLADDDAADDDADDDIDDDAADNDQAPSAGDDDDDDGCGC
ncbi:MAG: PKD domain-containing protein, partial [Alphaproteobacteria bacterium]